MISIEDIIGMTDLSEEEVAAIAEHEHIDMAPAAALADYLLHHGPGPAAIRQMIVDDIRAALRREDLSRAKALMGALEHYLSEHPEAMQREA